MRLAGVRYALVTLAVLAVGLGPASAAAPPQAIIAPGHGIGPALLGMTSGQIRHVLGTPDFQRTNDDGTALYEWGLLTDGDLPEALLWAMVDGTGVVKVGTDAERYSTFSGLHVGTPVEEFVKAYGTPTGNPAPGLYVFSGGIGIAVAPAGTVSAVWIESAGQ